MLAVRAGPPFIPLSRPSATTAGFLVCIIVFVIFEIISKYYYFAFVGDWNQIQVFFIFKTVKTFLRERRFQITHRN